MILTMEINNWESGVITTHTSQHVTTYAEMIDLVEEFAAGIQFGKKVELRLVISREVVND